MRILVVGSGGREHALCWKLAQEAAVHCCPGNPGIAEVAACHEVATHDQDGISELAKQIEADLVVIGPENPLMDGLADRLRSEHLNVFGPNRNGAMLEGSKAFAKELMLEAGVPTAHSYVSTDPEEALGYARSELIRGGWVVIKASGLAFGKGSVICGTPEEVEQTIQRMMVAKVFGESGATVVVERFLKGREFSLLTLVSGLEYRSLPVAQDYKRLLDSDEGPNTGGMGSYSPVAWLDEAVVKRAEKEVVEPILRAMAARGIDFHGVLFSGLMVNGDELNCIEYNVRFGDPEIQSVLCRLGDGLADSLLACARGETIPPLEILDNAALTVVLASAGYPESAGKGVPIAIDPDHLENVSVFHSGTALADGRLVTAGGRVMGVTATADSSSSARQRAYDAVGRVNFEGMQFRRDIGE